MDSCYYCESTEHVASCSRCGKPVCDDERRFGGCGCESNPTICLGCYIADMNPPSELEEKQVIVTDPLTEGVVVPETEDDRLPWEPVVEDQPVSSARVFHFPLDRLLAFVEKLQEKTLLELHNLRKECDEKARLAEHWMLYRRELAQITDREFYRRRYRVKRRARWKALPAPPKVHTKPLAKQDVGALAEALAKAGVTPETLLAEIRKRRL